MFILIKLIVCTSTNGEFSDKSEMTLGNTTIAPTVIYFTETELKVKVVVAESYSWDEL